MSKLLTFILVSLCLMTGCATPNIARDKAPDAAGSKGVVVGSITYNGAFPASYSVHYRPLPKGSAGRFSSGQALTQVAVADPNDFNEAGVTGNLIASELPAGDYEIFNWTVATGRTRVNAAEAFSIKFSVEAGRAVYLGNFDFAQVRNVSVEVASAEVTYQDTMARDLGVLKSLYPRLAETPVAAAVETGASVPQLGGRAGATITQPLVVRL